LSLLTPLSAKEAHLLFIPPRDRTQQGLSLLLMPSAPFWATTMATRLGNNRADVVKSTGMAAVPLPRLLSFRRR